MTDETILLQQTYELCQGIRRANGGWIVSTKMTSHCETEVVLPDIDSLMAYLRREAEKVEGYR